MARLLQRAWAMDRINKNFYQEDLFEFYEFIPGGMRCH